MSRQFTDLPENYEKDLARLSLFPAWTKLSQLVPLNRPIRHAGASHWRYEDSRKCLAVAGDLVPMELAERRVLGLVNPGFNPPRLATTPSIFAGLQLILPGEFAPAHRHTPSAARIVLEGKGGFTTVNGMAIPMEVGDLILTPPHHWHSHYHDGSEPAIWMDVLDHPVAIPLETSFLTGEEGGGRKEYQSPDSPYIAPGLIPFRTPLQAAPRYPIVHFPWKKTHEALVAMAAYTPAQVPVHLMFVNADTGESLFETLTFSVRMLRAGEEVHQTRRSASSIFQILEGDGESLIDNESFAWTRHDTLACPTFAEVRHRNRSSERPAFLLQVDDSVLQRKLGLYSEEQSS